MDKFKITAKGLVSLARIFVSCRPIMGGILTANQAYLIGQAKLGKDINFSEFKNGLPIVDPTYDHILEYAMQTGFNIIDEEVVYKFFGSEPHFKKILSQISEFKLKEDFAKKIFFAHMLIPVTITDVGENIYAVYKNKEVGVKIKNLVRSSKNISVNRGNKALVHYASIITTDFSGDLEEYLLAAQRFKKEFLEACKYVGEIDYANFWDLCVWTKQKNESCEL